MNNYRPVPLEPTVEMLVAGKYALEAGCHASVIYADMIAAAPAVQAEPVAVLYADGTVLTKAECGDSFTVCCKVQTPLYAAPQPAPEVALLQAELEREPVAWIVRHPRFCGKFTDDKETAEYWESKEQGCTAPLYTALQPAEQQPAPDVSALVEALERAVYRLESAGLFSSEAAIRGRATLAAHHKGGTDNE